MDERVFSQQNFDRLARLLVRVWKGEAAYRARYLSQWSSRGVRLVAAVTKVLMEDACG